LRRQAEAEAALRDWRARLQPGESVHVQRFGSVGRVVRVDHKRAVTVVSVGLGQWEVPLEEVTPPSEAV
jgi:DNA mismatch repair protein MutS2